MRNMIYSIGLATVIAIPIASASLLDPQALVGTWNCSFESNSQHQSLVGTSIDTYFPNGTSISKSNLSVQHYALGLDIAYELTSEGTWSITDHDTLQERITAVPEFSSSNPALEQVIGLQTELMNGQTDSARIMQLDRKHAIFQTMGHDDATHEIRCTR